MRIRFDQGPGIRPAARTRGAAPVIFDAPSRLIEAYEPADVPDALTALDAARAEGKWLAGFASYELGYALEPKLADRMPQDRRLPLLRFGVYDGPRSAPPVAAPEQPVALLEATPRWDAARYGATFNCVRDYIGAGDIYQANLTFPIDLRLSGSAAEVYAALATHQPVGHGALITQPDLPDLLCRSPELFFCVDEGGQIETRPMKGTMPRGANPQEDEANRAWLRFDEKNRAENLMIVDLLRNDLSRVAKAGSVAVPALFHVESYRTVHQMISRITAQLRPDAQLAEIFAALYPCGSITGAPKLRAMEILRDLEPFPREAYCGSIGWAAPDGRADFNVAIRTLMLEDDGRGVLNVGGGVVWDSTAQSEYEEALWKSRFVQAFLTEPS